MLLKKNVGHIYRKNSYSAIKAFEKLKTTCFISNDTGSDPIPPSFRVILKRDNETPNCRTVPENAEKNGSENFQTPA